MTQNQVYQILKKQTKPVNANEIYEILQKKNINLSENRVRANLKKLVDYKEIKFIEVYPKHAEVILKRKFNFSEYHNKLVRFYFI